MNSLHINTDTALVLTHEHYASFMENATHEEDKIIKIERFKHFFATELPLDVGEVFESRDLILKFLLEEIDDQIAVFVFNLVVNRILLHECLKFLIHVVLNIFCVLTAVKLS